MSMETIGPIVIVVMVLGFVLFVAAGVRGARKSAREGDGQQRHSLE